MSTYSLQIYDLSEALVSHPGLIEEHYDGLQWEWNAWQNNTFSLVSGATPTTVTISDTDTNPTALDDFSTGQVSTANATLSGTTYPPGTIFKDEYEIDLTDGVTTYRMVAIAVREYSDPWNYTDTVIGFAFEGPTPPPDTELAYVQGSAVQGDSYVPCFTRGTLIDTLLGPRRVETLRPGDRLRSIRGGSPRLLWVGRVQVSADRLVARPQLRPVQLRAGALGPGVPVRDLVVSPQHRILVRSKIAARIGGRREVLVAAKHLVGLPGITRAAPPFSTGVTYLHLLCARHVILVANGAAAESLFTGPQALTSLGWMGRRAIRDKLLHLGPEAAVPARPFLSGQSGRRLAAHHKRHGHALQ